jgi:hypothetical protein
MTPKEAVAIVKSKANGRTRYEGQKPFLDEVLVAEIERLEKEIESLRHNIESGSIEYISDKSYYNYSEQQDI